MKPPKKHRESYDLCKDGTAIAMEHGYESKELESWLDGVGAAMQTWDQDRLQKLDSASMLEAEAELNEDIPRPYDIRHMDEGKYIEAAMPVVMSSVFARLQNRGISAVVMRPAEPEEFLISALAGSTTINYEDEGRMVGGILDDFEIEEFGENESPRAETLGTIEKREPTTKKAGRYIVFSRESLWKHGTTINQYGLAVAARRSILEFRENKRLIPAILGQRGGFDVNRVVYNPYYAAAPIAAPNYTFTNGGPWVNVQTNQFVNLDNFTASEELGDTMTGLVKGNETPKSYSTVIASRSVARIMNAHINADRYEADSAGTLSGFGNVRFTGSASSLRGDTTTSFRWNRRFTNAVASTLGYSAAQADQFWIHGNINQALAWGTRNGWGATVEQLSRDTNMQLNQTEMGMMWYDAGEVVWTDPQEIVINLPN